MKQINGVEQAGVLGKIRRIEEMIGHLDCVKKELLWDRKQQYKKLNKLQRNHHEQGGFVINI